MAIPLVSSVPPSAICEDCDTRLVASTASAFFSAAAAWMLSRVSGVSFGIASQLMNAVEPPVLICPAIDRSNAHRWLRSGLKPTTNTRENDWSRDAPSDHPPLTWAWLGDAASTHAPSSNSGRRRAASTALVNTRCSSGDGRLSLLLVRPRRRGAESELPIRGGDVMRLSKAFALVCAFVASAAWAQDLTGKWTATAVSNNVAVTLDLKVAGNVVTGAILNPQSGPAEIKEGT